ncbi:FAD-dependent oxidoreductase [Kitasatospora sp. NBC_01560]|uniref:NAD(P)/FAD-dependent oxidoreductase n=1 Tax=Kitasatospora sp. NBC_01560 TaxID=2975965 RepID=UPI003868D6BB
MRGPELDAVIVGAGLAGLACALDLCRAGRRVAVLEASDAVGGRMRTDTVGEFTLDRGFQVVNTSYPQLRRRVDLRSLALHPFTPGYLLVGSAGRRRLTDPTRGPGRFGALLTDPPLPARDLAALGLLSTRDVLLPPALQRRCADVPTHRALRRSGLSQRAVDDVLAPFLAGVFLDDTLETSSRVFHLVWRSMLRGTLCLPRSGVGAVPAQLAAGLPAGVVRLESPVTALTDEGVVLADGSVLAAPTVVVATGAAAAARLLPGHPLPAMRAVTTVYHAAPVPPLRDPTLLVDTDGVLLNSVVLSEVVPAYARNGRALVSTSLLGVDRDTRRVPARLAELYGTDTSDWEELAVYRIADALPAMPSPHPLSRPTRWSRGRFVCGDHRATGSVQGALASGARAAREVLADAAGS